jgi:hypothetical protein
VKFWTTPQELGGQVAKSLIQTRKTHPAEGWVRAGDAMTPEVQQELVELRARVAELTSKLTTERAQHALAIPEGLADGQDTVRLAGFVEYYPQKFVDAEEMVPKNKSRAWYSIDTTWDDLFAALAPSMMDECSEVDLENVLGEYMRKLMNDETDKFAKKDKIGWFMSVDPKDETFDDVVRVQFPALGYTRSGDRRRAPSDSNSYWILTDLGREHMMRLRASRKAPEKKSPPKQPGKKSASAKKAAKKAT